jgi:hypothetical protein
MFDVPVRGDQFFSSALAWVLAKLFEDFFLDDDLFSNIVNLFIYYD